MRNATALHPNPARPPRSGKALAALQKERARWLSSLADGSCYRILDHVPGVYFFAKDREGRTMFASRGILERYGMRDENEMLGLTDFDLNPGSMAEGYVRDDARLLAGKIQQIERLELWFDLQGMPDWFVVTKLPLMNRRGRPQGVIGVLRRAEENEMRLPIFQTVAQAVRMIRQDYARAITIAEVATACGQSLRQLQRRFRAAFGITPQEFLLKTRVLAAAQLLEETTLSTTEIALRCGFGEASAFTQHFRKRTGSTPLSYRRDKRTRPPGRDATRRQRST